MAKSLEYISKLENIDNMTEEELLEGFNSHLLFAQKSDNQESSDKISVAVKSVDLETDIDKVELIHYAEDEPSENTQDASIDEQQISVDKLAATPPAAAAIEAEVQPVPEKTVVSTDAEAELDSIPIEERDRILEDIDQAVASNRLEISDTTFQFTAEKNDWVFPVSFIGVAATIVICLAFYLTSIFSKIEVDIVEGSVTVDRAQSELIERLRSQSEIALLEKENEIASIYDSIALIESEKAEWDNKYREQAVKLEQDLRRKMEGDLQAERQRLEATGINEDQINEQLQAFSASKEADLAINLDRELEALSMENEAKEEEYNQLIENEKQALGVARDEAFVLERTIEEPDEYIAIQVEDAALANDSVASNSQNSQKNNELQELHKKQELEKLITNQLSTAYLAINDYIEVERFEQALEAIRALESMLEDPDIAQLSVVIARENYDSSMITTLRNYTLLQMNERNQIDPDPIPSLPISENPSVPEVAETNISDGFSLTEEELTAMKELAAREAIAGAESEYKIRMQELQAVYEELKAAYREERQFAGTLVSQANIKIEEDINAALDSYRKALDAIINEDGSASVMIDKLLEAGIELEKQKGKVLVTQNELQELADIKNQQQEVKDIIQNIENAESVISSSERQEQLLNLVEIKLLIREVLADASLDEKYADLYEKMDVYLNAYGILKEKEGRERAAKEISNQLSDIIEN